jgi:hypothetical protein
MIHHAVLGSLERFAAILLEHHGGQLPLWLAAEQVVVAPVAGPQVDYARRVAAEFETRDLRVERDGTVTASRRSGDPVTMPLADLVRQLRSEATRSPFRHYSDGLLDERLYELSGASAGRFATLFHPSSRT